jgi:DNA-binding transcriptional LysR family regulator
MARAGSGAASPRQPTLRQLRTYLALVEAGGVAAAAQALHLTQPAASQHLRELESIFGVRLLDRARGRTVPTAAGDAIIEPSRRALAAIADAMAAAAPYASQAVGRVRLGTGATACIHLLPPVLRAVKQAMPGLEIIIVTGNTEEIVRRIEDGDIDIGLVTLPHPIGRGLHVEKLLADPLVALLPVEDLPAGAATRPAITAAELKRWPLILYERGGATRRVIDAWLGTAKVLPNIIMELGNIEAIKVLVGLGLGASILPGLAVRTPVPGAIVRPLRPVPNRHLGTVLRKEKILSPGLRLLLREIRALGQR